MGYDQVLSSLPQGYPFVFIDVVKEVVPGERIICLKNVTGNEWMFPGHFPGKSVYPGVLIVEGMAQASILLFKAGHSREESHDMTFLLSSVKTRFVQAVVPGDQLLFECRVLKMYSRAGVVEAIASVGEKRVAKAELSFAVVESDRL